MEYIGKKYVVNLSYLKVILLICFLELCNFVYFVYCVGNVIFVVFCNVWKYWYVFFFYGWFWKF